MLCKNCEEKEGIKYSKYANGEFCSKFCAKSYSTKINRMEINKKVSKSLIGKKYNIPESSELLFKRHNITIEDFIEKSKNSKTAKDASIKLNLSFSTYRRYAKYFNVYKTNQGKKGIKRKHKTRKEIPLSDIIYNNKYPNYQSNKLRLRLIKEGIKKEQCENCNITEWNGKKLSFELEHKDGNKRNHNLENLEILCPNCHSQTETYRGKNINRNKKYNF